MPEKSTQRTAMQEKLAGVVENLPDHAGIYIMKNPLGQIIYVGKAISLKNRVRNYFQPSTWRDQPKTRRLVQDVADIDYVLARDEREALMLEINMIKEHQPKYNILLKDGKHYPYLRLDTSADYPRLEIVRSIKKNDKARYFGPYMATNSLRATVEAVKRIFPIRSCGKDIGRAIERNERPCLNAQIGLCLAPCTGQVDKAEYAEVVRQVARFLQGHHAELARGLQEKMEQAAEALDFERAANYRDKLQAVRSITHQSAMQGAISTSVGAKDADVIGIAIDGDEAAVQLMMMRAGKVIGSEGFMMRGSENETPGDVAAGFIAQFYLNGVSPPGQILMAALPENTEYLQDILQEQSGHKVLLTMPQRGEKRALVMMAQNNAQERLKRERLLRQRKWEREGGAAEALGEALGIPTPHRIECYDISNIQGTDSVASMVVFEDGKAARKAYRRFKIKTVEGANDFESMREVLTRRFRHGLEERAQIDAAGGDYSKGSFSKFPDLVLIDGGRIQLEFAQNAMRELGVGHIPAVGLAKRFEQIIRENEPDPLELPKSSPTLHLLQRVRDEAHRFAITYHRSLRTARTLQSQLETIPGIGEKRRKALLRAYPIPDLMKKATLEELQAVGSMSQKAAQAVYDALHRQEEASEPQET